MSPMHLGDAGAIVKSNTCQVLLGILSDDYEENTTEQCALTAVSRKIEPMIEI